LDRAAEQGVQVRKLSDTRWTVTSGTQAGVVYTLFVEGEQVRCSCKGAEFGLVCKHAAAVRARLTEHQEVSRMIDELYGPA